MRYINRIASKFRGFFVNRIKFSFAMTGINRMTRIHREQLYAERLRERAGVSPLSMPNERAT